MEFSVQIQETLPCDIERAFKTPMLCDVTLIHTGYGLMPRLTHVSDDSNWGKPGSSKRVFAAKSWTQKGGFVSMDHVLERKENERWNIKVDQFQAWMLGFYQFNGTWETTAKTEETTEIQYSYVLKAKGSLLIPFQWLFAHIFWKRYMRHVLTNIKQLIANNTPLMYE
jgi:hypothetical protein